MYHRVSAATADEMTVPMEQLETQLKWIVSEGLRFTSMAELLEGGLSGNSVLVTFDDAYTDNFVYARPVLMSLGIKPTVFVPTAYIGATSSWDAEAHPLMSASQLASLAADGFELGFHSHRHDSYSELSPAEIRDDVAQGVATMCALGLPKPRAFAYPYGARPTDPAAKQALRASLSTAAIDIAFRIGNRINPLPLLERFEVQRLSVRGDRDLASFKRKVAFGKLI